MQDEPKWSSVEILFGDGVDTQTDPKAVVQSKLIQAQNVIFPKPGTLRTRFGNEIISTVTNARQVTKRQGELLTLDDNYLRSEIGVLSGGLAREARLTGMLGVRRDSIIRDAARVAVACDSAIVGDICVTVGQMTSGSPYVANATEVTVYVSRVSTGELISRSIPYSSPVFCTKCVAVGQYVWIFYADLATGNLRGTRFDTVALSFDTADGLRLGGMTGDFDVSPYSGTDFLLLAPVGAVLNVYRLGPTLATVANVGIATTSIWPCSVYGTVGEWVSIAWRDEGTGALRLKGLNSGLGSLFAAVTLDAAYPGRRTNGIGRVDATHVVCVWDTDSAVPHPAVSHNTVSNAGVLGTLYTQYQRALESKPWTDASGVVRVLVGNGDAIQGTVYASNLSAPTIYPGAQTDAIIARGISSTAGGHRDFGLPKVSAAAGGTFRCPLITKQKVLLGFSYNNTEQAGIDLLTFDHTSLRRLCTAELGGLLYIAGGQLLCYDGLAVFEAGFASFPQKPSVGESAGGSTTIGTHQYVIVWEYTDAFGNVHRSSPSLAASHLVAAPNQTINLIFPPLSFSQKELTSPGNVANAPKVMAVPYGTLANDTVFHRLKATSLCRQNYISTDVDIEYTIAPFTDNDATIGTFPALYTDGDVLPNLPPPSCEVIATHQNRLFVVSSEDGTIWFSKEYIVGEAPGFNDALTFQLPSGAERPTALASFDEKLLVLTRTQAYVVTGAFPNDTGAGGDIQITRIPTDVGCLDWRTLVVTNQGAFFGALKGIFMISRGLEVTYAGKDVEFWTENWADMTTGLVTDDRSEIRFAVKGPILPEVAPSGQVLVFNFRNTTAASPHGTWSTFDYSNTVYGDFISSVAINNDLYTLTATGQVLHETQSFSDSGVWITTRVETANVYPFGRQGYGRYRTATFLGTYRTSHSVEIQVAYDGDDVFTESSIFARATVDILAREQVTYHLKQQKASGVRFIVQSLQDGATPAEEFFFSGIVLECMPKRGSRARGMPREASQ